MAFEWRGPGATAKGVVERDFTVGVGERRVPGVAWTPDAPRRNGPLVLIGHGGSGHKREPHIVALARRLVRHHGFAAAAIDGPVHGERRAPDAGPLPFEEARRVYLTERATDAMVADWRATLDALCAEGVASGPVGYWGLSMGTIFGLPFVAAESRVRAAVLGLMGTAVPTGERLLRDASRIACPVLFLQQWHDELCPRGAVSELFDALATDDKRLHANPGAHAAVPRDEFLATQAFLAERLGAA